NLTLTENNNIISLRLYHS
ncbi:unnamed protein product, partial [Allacma fusca]